MLDLPGSMEDFIDGEMAASGAPGLAYAVVDDGHVTSAEGRGVITAGGAAEVTPDTPFLTGSISKSLTALAVMQLVEAGEIDLDSEVSHYLEDFSGRPAGAVTVRQLYRGEGSRWLQRSVFVSLVLLPAVYLLSMVWAWRRRAEIRAKAWAFGLFSWWFPLLTTLAAAWVIVSLVPDLYGVPLRTLGLFQPDLRLALIATAVTGVSWAVLRLGVA
jgi:hypothetical protein